MDQQIDRQSALQTSQKENNNRIPFTLTFHAVKSIILQNFKLFHNDRIVTIKKKYIFEVETLPHHAICPPQCDILSRWKQLVLLS